MCQVAKLASKNETSITECFQFKGRSEGKNIKDTQINLNAIEMMK